MPLPGSLNQSGSGCEWLITESSPTSIAGTHRFTRSPRVVHSHQRMHRLVRIVPLRRGEPPAVGGTTSGTTRGGAVSLLPSADVFRSIELKVSELLGGQLVCPHAPGERCSVGEHLTLSEAKDAAARDAADLALRDTLWRCVGRDARSDLPNLAQRSQCLRCISSSPTSGSRLGECRGGSASTSPR